MKRKIISILLTLLLVILPFTFLNKVEAAVRVNGYYRSNGTYVQPHYRSSPNNTVIDNYSFKGNVNPYTGEVGTKTYSNSPSSPYYTGSSYVPPSSNTSSYSPVYTTPHASSYMPTTSYGNYNSYAASAVPVLRTVNVSTMAKAWSQKYPTQDCLAAPLTMTDRQGCVDYRASLTDANIFVKYDYNVDKAYTTCDGGSNYYLLNSDGTSYVCPQPQAKVNDRTALVNSLKAQIEALMAQLQAMQSSGGY